MVARGDRHFQLIANSPPAWSWEKYSTWLRVAWRACLAESDPLNEDAYHQFLEQHPCLIPGADGDFENPGGHHGSWNDVVISKPMVPGLRRHYPDFMWLTKNSESIIPIFVEIEAPGKTWFNEDRTRSAKLTQAQDQIAEWSEVLENPASRLQLGEMYDFPRRWTLTYSLVPRFILVYGRREEFTRRPHLNQKRRWVQSRDVEAMTYDRLVPQPSAANAVSARTYGSRPRVIAIPPTFRLGPLNANAVAFLDGWEEAISISQLLSAKRKDFLLERVPYWRTVVEQNGGSFGAVGPNDWE